MYAYATDRSLVEVKVKIYSVSTIIQTSSRNDLSSTFHMAKQVMSHFICVTGLVLELQKPRPVRNNLFQHHVHQEVPIKVRKVIYRTRKEVSNLGDRFISYDNWINIL